MRLFRENILTQEIFRLQLIFSATTSRKTPVLGLILTCTTRLTQRNTFQAWKMLVPESSWKIFLQVGNKKSKPPLKTPPLYDHWFESYASLKNGLTIVKLSMSVFKTPYLAPHWPQNSRVWARLAWLALLHRAKWLSGAWNFSAPKCPQLSGTDRVCPLKHSYEIGNSVRPPDPEL